MWLAVEESEKLFFTFYSICVRFQIILKAGVLIRTIKGRFEEIKRLTTVFDAVYTHTQKKLNSATGAEFFVSAECEMWRLAVKEVAQKFFTQIFFQSHPDLNKIFP
jgi:hypothetical protein